MAALSLMYRKYFLHSEYYRYYNGYKSCMNQLFLVMETQGIGDAAQGWVNAFLYIFASSKLRKRLFWDPLSHVTCWSKRRETVQTTSDSTLHVQYQDTAERRPFKVSVPSETLSPTLVPTGIGAASDN